ncbi:hypothetical protein D4N21_29705 (plasmid) [Klebsiella variicola]|nr:hypothetical protein D4N21_29705 [Klebsiella variicola]
MATASFRNSNSLLPFFIRKDGDVQLRQVASRLRMNFLRFMRIKVNNGLTATGLNVAPLQGERHGSAVPMVFMP